MEDRSKRLADSFGNARFGRFFYKKRLLENLPKLFFFIGEKKIILQGNILIRKNQQGNQICNSERSLCMNNQTSFENRKISVIPELIGWCMLLYAIVIPIYCKYFYDGSGLMPVWLSDHFTLIKSWPMSVYFIFYFVVFRVLCAACRRRELERNAVVHVNEYELMDPNCRDGDNVEE